MHVCEISIKNFRAIRDLQGLHVHDLTSIVGKNDCGKSSVLLALEAFFAKKVQEQDFCSIGECAEELWVQLTFDELPQEIAEQLDKLNQRREAEETAKIWGDNSI